MTLATTQSAVPTAEKLRRARRAAPQVAALSGQERGALLSAMAAQVQKHEAEILEANRADLDASRLPSSLRDRLLLTPERIGAMVEGVRAVIELPDPVGSILEEWVRPNGLRIRKVRVPLGVVGVIYEARPNVTVDVAALTLKSGNAVVLRGSREASRTNEVLVALLNRIPGLPAGAIELLDAGTRDSVAELIRARESVDVLVPRGGASLIAYVVENATVPVIETGAGNCHIYVDDGADFEMADGIVLNSKTQRPSVCNAAETLLIHQGIAAEYVPRIVERLLASGVEVRGDEKTRQLAHGLAVEPAGPDDWSTEYLDLRIAVGVVKDLDDAIAHINRYSTKHSEVIVTPDEERAQRFLTRVDSAVVYWNASTRFTDGAEFGFGAEMGISTQKLHCRGPFALAELTSAKYEVRGTGQIRT